MKKLSLIVSFFLAMNTITSQTAKTTTTTPMVDHEASGKNVPAGVMNKFKTDYPSQAPTWTMEDGNYRANFVDGTKMYGHAVAYDKAGNVVYREEQIAPDAMPGGVKDYYTANYPNDKYEVWSSTDKSGKRRYYSNHNLETLWFDENGTYVQKSKVKKPAN